MQENKFPLVSVQILNWNRPEETIRSIKGLKVQDYPNFEIVLIDNGSDDHSVKSIKQTFPDLTYVELDRNYGCPGGRNRGIERCAGEFIFFCDNDGVLHKSAISNAMKIMQGDEKIGIVTGRVVDFSSEEEIDLEFQISEIEQIDHYTFQGGIALLKKEIFLRISKYPDDYMYGSEEFYLGLKVMDNGFRIVKTGSVVLWHKKSDKARNISKELQNSWRNKLANTYQLYPIEHFITFTFYFILVYPVFAFRNNFFLEFMNGLPGYLKNAFKYKRDPIKRDTYKKYLFLKKKNG